MTSTYAPSRSSDRGSVPSSDHRQNNRRENDETSKELEFATFLQSVWLVQGRIREGLAWLDTALADDAKATSSLAATQVRALADKALLDSWYGSLDIPDVGQVEAGLEIARESGDPALLIRALLARGCVVLYELDAEPYFVEAARLARDLGDWWRLSQILERQSYRALFVTGDLHVVLSANEGRDLARRIGDQLTAHQCGVYIAGALTTMGDLAGALAQARSVTIEAGATHDLLSEMTGLMAESIVLSYQGDAAGAHLAISRALDGAPDIGDYFESACHPNIALAYLAGGDIPAAWRACERALPTITHLYNAVNAYVVVNVALAAGELATARSVVDSAVSMARGCWIAVGLTARARVKIAYGESRSAEADLHEALAAAARTDALSAVPEAFEALAQLASAAGGHHETARLLGAADSLRLRMTAVRLVVFDGDVDTLLSDVRHALGDNDFEADWAEGAALSTEQAIAYAQRGRGERKRPSSGWGSLTPTELDVVRLVAEGIPNKDIAVRLFVSPRTVQSHLRHVYNKLALTSRVQLAQEAARRS
jgi:DNA-binding CsgD family transcriptional regulator